MACRLAKKKCKIIWCRISVVSSVSQILVQNLCCISVAKLLYYLKWPAGWPKKKMQNHLVQNLCCLVGLPNFGAESLLFRFGPPSSSRRGGGYSGYILGDLALISRIPRADLRSHARTHATQTQTRNTISRLGDPRRIHPPNLRYTYKRP